MNFTMNPETEIEQTEILDMIYQINIAPQRNKRNSSPSYESEKVRTFMINNEPLCFDIISGSVPKFLIDEPKS